MTGVFLVFWYPNNESALVAQLDTCLPVGRERWLAEGSMYYVYVLKSEQDGTLYIGQAEKVERRLREHNAGRTKSTKGRRPYTLEYQEGYKTREEALARERKLKSGAGREFLKRVCARSSTGYLPAGRQGALACGGKYVLCVCSQERTRRYIVHWPGGESGTPTARA